VLQARGELDEARYLLTESYEGMQAVGDLIRAAIDALERLARGERPAALPDPLSMRQVWTLLDLTRDELRSWERNNLLRVARDPGSGYRLYGAEEIARLRVIRMLRRAGFGLLSVLQALNRLDAGQLEAARAVFTAPEDSEDILHVADRWLEMLCGREAAALRALEQLNEMRIRYSRFDG